MTVATDLKRIGFSFFAVKPAPMTAPAKAISAIYPDIHPSRNCHVTVEIESSPRNIEPPIKMPTFPGGSLLLARSEFQGVPLAIGARWSGSRWPSSQGE